jgi:hypothetical protein
LAQSDAGFVERNQTPVQNGDPVATARETGEHSPWAGEGRLGTDHLATEEILEMRVEM